MTIRDAGYNDGTAQSAVAVHYRLHRGAIAEFGRWSVNYALVLIFFWFGCLKFTDFEASAIAPLVMNSPLVMWWHGLLGINGTAHMLGCYEILTALLLALRPVAPRWAAVGGSLAAVCFLVTISFMFTTPGVTQPGAAAPFALSPMPGQFLLKDVVLLAASIWVTGSAATEAAECKANR